MKRLVSLLAVFAAALVCILLLGAPEAIAATDFQPADVAEGDIPTDPLQGLKDSQGVPAEKYLTTPVDRGDIWHPRHVIDGWFIDMLWGPYTGAFKIAMWVIHFVFSFTWVDWLVAPVEGISSSIFEVINPIKGSYIGFAMALTGLVYGWAMLRGRMAHGLTNIFITIGVLVLLLGSLANPMTSVFGTDGAFDKFRNAGNEVAVVLATNGEQSSSDLTASEVINKSVSSKLTDVLLREPIQYVAFGKSLQGKCDETFTEKIQKVRTGDAGDKSVREAIAKCDKQAKDYLSAPTGTLDVMAGSFLLIGGILLFVLLFFAILAGAVLFLAWRTCVLIGQLLLGLLPGRDRAGLWESLVMVIYGLFLSGFALALFVIFLLGIVQVMDFLEPMGRNKFLLVLVVTAVSAFLLIKYRSWLRERAKKLSDRLKSALGGQGENRRPVTVKGAVSTVRNAAHTISSMRTSQAVRRQNRMASSPAASKLDQRESPSRTPGQTPASSTSAKVSDDAPTKGHTTSPPAPTDTPVNQRKKASAARGTAKAAAMLVAKRVPYVGTAVTVASTAVNVAKTIKEKTQSGEGKVERSQKKVARLDASAQSVAARKEQRQERVHQSMDRIDRKIAKVQPPEKEHTGNPTTEPRAYRLMNRMDAQKSKAEQVAQRVPRRQERVQEKLAAAQKIRDAALAQAQAKSTQKNAREEALRRRAQERRSQTQTDPEPVKVSR